MALRIPIPTTVVLSALAATAPLVAPLTAQDTLAALQQKFIQEREELQRSRGAEFRFEDVRELAAKHAAELERWLDGERSDADEVNGRLMLTEIYLSSGREEDGRRTLRSIDTATAPPVELAAAAEMATMLGMVDDWQMGYFSSASTGSCWHVDVCGKDWVEGVELSMHIGITAGHVYSMDVGGVFGRWETVVSGVPVMMLEPVLSQARRSHRAVVSS